jgi:acetolactate synthase-1/2/3 large subunit
MCAIWPRSYGRPFISPARADLPKDIASGVTEFKYPQEVRIRGYQPTLNGHAQQIKRALHQIIRAHRPVIYAGGGVIISNAAPELTTLAEVLSIPVTTTLMGLGGIPGTHPLSLGMLGMHGTYRANMAVTDCDLLIAVGARFDDRVTGRIDAFAPNAKKIHIDIDPTSISKNVRVDIPIVGDCQRVLSAMLALLKEEKGLDEHRYALAPWHEQIEQWKNTHRLVYQQDQVIKPQYVIEKIYEMTKGKAIISTEVGQNQMWTAQYYLFDRPRTLLTSGGLGTMGYGLPAAIGAQVAFPDRTVIDIAGDGSIQMNIQELATAVQYKLPVKVAILNNGYLGMVRQWQELFYERRYAMTHIGDISPDFVKLAEAYGAMGLRATKPAEIVPVVREALRTPLPVLMDFVVEPEEGVYPMVPAGEAIDRMLLV